MKFIKLVNPEDVSEQEASSYKKREAVRAIVYDRDGLVAMFHSTVNHYYKIPGGGVDEGETIEQAIKRECREEIGCDIEIISELGLIIEYRKKYKLHQTSYCYIAKLVREKGAPQLMPDEIEEGFEPVWLTLEDAIEKVRDSEQRHYEVPYMTTRDLAFLEAALKANK